MLACNCCLLVKVQCFYFNHFFFGQKKTPKKVFFLIMTVYLHQDFCFQTFNIIIMAMIKPSPSDPRASITPWMLLRIPPKNGMSGPNNEETKTATASNNPRNVVVSHNIPFDFSIRSAIFIVKPCGWLKRKKGALTATPFFYNS